MKRVLAPLAIAACTLLLSAGAVFATGQPGAPANTCGNPGATSTPGGSGSAAGAPFNPVGQAGLVYAGNPGTASLANSQSGNAISQYDIACFKFTAAKTPPQMP